jgi:hypothetical protein
VARTSVESVEDGWSRVSVVWRLKDRVSVDEVSVRIEPGFDPDFWWAPHLSPEKGFCIAQHVFRSPALIVGRGSRFFSLVPDLDCVGRDAGAPWYLDFDAREKSLWIGLSRTKVEGHVLFRKRPGWEIDPGEVGVHFYVSLDADEEEAPNPWGRAARFLWNRWGRVLFESGEPVPEPLDRYVEHAYRWAFSAWEDPVWQEFAVNGVRVGAPQFVVHVHQSPNYPGEWDQREHRSIWNQAWFSSLRSASGVLRYARRTGNADLERRALLTKELALAAPVDRGLFPSVIRTENKEVRIGGEVRVRPLGWKHSVWTNSNRCPVDHGITTDWIHVLDASWTGLQMLRWYRELEADERLLERCRGLAKRLFTLQDEEGFFPGWLHPETQEPGPVMNRTAESCVSATFLLEMDEVFGGAGYREAALRCVEAVLRDTVPAGRWEDFETYWSCAAWGRELLGKRIERNAMHKQNTLSMFWTAEALLRAWSTTGNTRYLSWGRRTLDELSMAQQVWQPPFIHVPALGGFGVMNADGEWNDARQSLFSELYLDYYRATGEAEYFERGVAALRASFIMMYCPENDRTRTQWEKAYPWLGAEDYGFMMENYGHGGFTSAEGEGMGFFTIYDWGPGSAAEARERVRAHYGDVYVDRVRGRAFAIDVVGIEKVSGGWLLTDARGEAREIRVGFEDGSSSAVRLEGQVQIEAR